MKKTISFCLFLIIFLTGCTSSKSRVGGFLNLDTDLKITFLVKPDINPDDNNRPSPLFIRFYQLKDYKIFERMDFLDIYERDKEILGDTLISKNELKPFIPGTSRHERFVLNSGVKYIAIYAEFSQYSSSGYKLIFPVTENNVIRNNETIEISDRNLIRLKK